MKLDRVALRLDQRDVTYGEAALAAMLSGQAGNAVDRLSSRMACAALAQNEGFTIPKGRRQQGFDDWRRQRDLISKDDYRSLLAAWEVDRRSVLAYVDRCIHHEMLSDRIDEARQVYEPSLPDVMRLLPEEVLFEGAWGGMIAGVALHLVAAPLPDDVDAAVVRRDILDAAGLGDPETFQEVSDVLEVRLESAAWLVEREVEFSHQRKALWSQEQMERELRRRRSELEVLRLDVVETKDEDIANELVWCVRLDEEPLAHVAVRAKLPCLRQNVLFKDLGGSILGNRAAGARDWEAIGPVETDGGFVVGQLVERGSPSLQEPTVLGFLRTRLLQRAFGREVARRVRVVGAKG